MHTLRFVHRLLALVLDIAVIALVLRFVLQLFGADPAATFMAFILRVTDPLVIPFVGLFPPGRFGSIVVEWSSLVAMIVVALVIVLLLRVFRILLDPVRRPKSAVPEEQEWTEDFDE